MGIAEDLIIIIIAGLVSGLVAGRIKMPPVIGYIIAGIIIGPYTGGITVSDIPRIEMLAEIGVALLLFSIGMDFSFKELKSVRAIALYGTPVQVLLLIAYGFTVGRIVNMSFNESVVFGMVISLSSTMVVLKILMSRGLVGTLSARVMVGILIVQDLAAIPLMLIIPNLSSIENNITPLLFTLLKAFMILLLIVLIGVRVIPWILKFVVRSYSKELFLITITATGLGVGLLTHVFGLSLAFGAFVAGMVISESDYSHQALSDIIPLRDIFGLVFFTSVGMLINPAFIYKNLGLVLLLVFLILAGKVIVFSTLGVVFKYFNIIPLALGLNLSQVGEFSFVLARTGLSSKIIGGECFSLILSVSVITMILSPFLSLLAAPLYSLKRRRFKHEKVETVNLPEGGIGKHVVIAGGGRVGFQIASFFRETGYPYVVIEQDFRRFEKSKEAGFPVIYGDAGREPVLTAAKTGTARLVIVTVPFISSAREIITLARMHNPGIKIIARADDLSHAGELAEMNIYEVVQPEFEAGLEIIRQSLLLLDVPLTEIFGITDSIRHRGNFKPDAGILKKSILANIRKTPFLLEISWFEVVKGSPILGRSAGEMAIRTKTGASVVGVFRNNDLIPNPGSGFVFMEGDYIAIIGLPENKKLFENILFP